MSLLQVVVPRDDKVQFTQMLLDCGIDTRHMTTYSTGGTYYVMVQVPKDEDAAMLRLMYADTWIIER
jgi:hypothetical protein